MCILQFASGGPTDRTIRTLACLCRTSKSRRRDPRQFNCVCLLCDFRRILCITNPWIDGTTHRTTPFRLFNDLMCAHARPTDQRELLCCANYLRASERPPHSATNAAQLLFNVMLPWWLCLSRDIVRARDRFSGVCLDKRTTNIAGRLYACMYACTHDAMRCGALRCGCVNVRTRFTECA